MSSVSPAATGPSRILVATDFSENAQYALDYVRVLAQAQGARVVLHTSIDLPDPHSMVGGALRSLGDYETLRAEAEARLQAEAERAQLGSLLEAVHVGKYRPQREVLAAANSHACDLIVMGTRGHRGVERFFLGSVSERIVRESPVPVLVIPMPDAS